MSGSRRRNASRRRASRDMVRTPRSCLPQDFRLRLDDARAHLLLERHRHRAPLLGPCLRDLLVRILAMGVSIL
jgi:hypothetical protein